ncbi:MAG: hypothetical protein D084_Lepto4C00153G0002 [Leptospirillum sp. Group IV 'UBA BS']|nr:MAG: hypothetical protein D084_Lepto4C00153G0002 [Leptospirillum sp. Group IV 'UBA BS']
MSESLKETAKNILIDCVINNPDKLISYSDLIAKIRSTIPTDIGPHDQRLFHLLAEISTEEDKHGRGMLSAVVVREVDKRPGNGFFELAKDLGKNTSDKDACWIGELNKVYAQWGGIVPSGSK